MRDILSKPERICLFCWILPAAIYFLDLKGGSGINSKWWLLEPEKDKDKDIKDFIDDYIGRMKKVEEVTLQYLLQQQPGKKRRKQIYVDESEDEQEKHTENTYHNNLPPSSTTQPTYHQNTTTNIPPSARLRFYK